MNAIDDPTDEAFAASQVLFDTVVEFLDGVAAAGMEHAELEDQLQEGVGTCCTSVRPNRTAPTITAICMRRYCWPRSGWQTGRDLRV